MTYKYAEVFKGNRARVASMLSDGEALIHIGGDGTERYGTDTDILFRQESNFMYLTGVNEPDCLTLIRADGHSVLLYPYLDLSVAVWYGRVVVKEEKRDEYLFDDCILYKADDLEKILIELTKDLKVVYFLDSYNADRIFRKAPKFNMEVAVKMDTESVMDKVIEARVEKSDGELDLIRYACNTTSSAFIETMKETVKRMKGGEKLMEYQIENRFLYECYEKACRQTAYITIAASGANNAVLHYGVNSEEVGPNNLILLDAGCEYQCYASDITRCWPVSGKFSEKQKAIYSIVLESQKAVFDMLKAGTEYAACYSAVMDVFHRGLSDLGIITPHGKSARELLELKVLNLFMPHGLGHLVGIDVHDVGGKRTQTHPNRLNRPLKPKMVLTIEPGIYFVPLLLEPAFKNKEQNKYLCEEKIREYMEVGGVRIEDDVIITEDGYENLTKTVPKEIADIEKLLN